MCLVCQQSKFPKSWLFLKGICDSFLFFADLLLGCHISHLNTNLTLFFCMLCSQLCFLKLSNAPPFSNVASFPLFSLAWHQGMLLFNEYHKILGILHI